jgi:flavin-dependent dehydrogenase
LKIKNKYHCDVLVIGGGAAGIAAAITARRQGLDVILLERYGFCGGGAVAGYSGTVCGLYTASEKAKQAEQLVFGFCSEFLNRLKKNDGVAEPVMYGKTMTRVHHPDIWKYTADQMLLEAGVRIFFHCRVFDVLQEGELIEGVLATAKEGVLEFRAGITVDASGDADVIQLTKRFFSTRIQQQAIDDDRQLRELFIQSAHSRQAQETLNAFRNK